MTYTPLLVTSMDHQQLKQELIAFLQASDEFNDFDFEGSALNTVIDLLVRNTHYDAFLANMVANESFIQSAQLRGNVVSHAQKLSYTPRSASASKSVVNLIIRPASSAWLLPTLTIPKGIIFIGKTDNSTYSFVTKNSYQAKLVSNYYVCDNVELYQGELIQQRYIHSTNEAIELPNSLIDTKTLSVQTLEDGIFYPFSLANSVSEIDSGSDYYFLSENYRGNYQIEFGKNLIGREPESETPIDIEYILTSEDHANGISTYIAATTINGYSNITVITDTPSYGGSDREEKESIRFNAPRFYATQDRALNPFDYQILLKSRYAFIDSIKAWGGEDNDPPEYGKVFISIISDEYPELTQAIKDDMIAYLKDFNIGSITPEFSDSKKISINLSVSFDYDEAQTSKTFNQLSTDIGTAIETYSTNYLNDFGTFYNNAKLVQLLMNIRGIETVVIDKTISASLPVIEGVDPTYTFKFSNQLVPGSVLIEDLIVAENGIDHKIYDKKDGKLYVHYKIDSIAYEYEIGIVDYDSGEISFILTVLSNDDLIVYAEPHNDNVVATTNKYLDITNVVYTSL